MKKNVLAIIVLIIIAIGSNIFFYNLGKGNLKTENVPIKEKEDPMKKYYTETEKKITDTDLISKIQEKDNRLHYFSFLNFAGKYDEDRLKNIEVIAYFEYMLNTEYAKEITIEEYNALMDCDCAPPEGDIKLLKFEDLNILMKEMFGLEVQELQNEVELNGYYYHILPNDFTVIRTHSNVPIGPDIITRDNYKYTEDDNNYYVYFNYSVTKDGKTYHNYIDYIESKEGNKEVAKMDSTNYDEFPLIKVTYKKNGSNFYFKGFEVLEDR